MIIFELQCVLLHLFVVLVVVDDVLPLWSLTLGRLGPSLLLFFCGLPAFAGLLIPRFTLLRKQEFRVLYDLFTFFQGAHTLVSLLLFLLLRLVFLLGHSLDLEEVLDIWRLAADNSDRYVFATVCFREAWRWLCAHGFAAKLGAFLPMILLPQKAHLILIIELVHETWIQLTQEIAASLIWRRRALLAQRHLIVLALVLLALASQPQVRLLHRIYSLPAVRGLLLLSRRVWPFLRAGTVFLLIHSSFECGDRHFLYGFVFEVGRVQQQLLLVVEHLDRGVDSVLAAPFDVASMRLAFLRLLHWAAETIWADRVTKVRLRFHLAVLAMLQRVLPPPRFSLRSRLALSGFLRPHGGHVLLRIVALGHVLVQAGALAPASSLVRSDPLLAALPVIDVVVLALTEASLGSSILLVLRGHLLDVLVLPLAVVHVLLMVTLHVGKARVEVAGVLGCLVPHKHSHVAVAGRVLLFLPRVRPCQVLVNVRTVVKSVQHIAVLNQILLEVLIRYLVVERLVQFLLLQLLEQFDSFLSRRPHRLVLVHPANVQDRQQVVNVAGDLVFQVRTDRVQGIDGDPLRLCVLRLLDLLDQVREELLVIVFEVYLDVEDQRDQALEELLVRQELLRLHDVAHLVGDLFELLEKDIVRAIHYDLG